MDEPVKQEIHQFVLKINSTPEMINPRDAIRYKMAVNNCRV